jgi:hypothetical protein
VKTRDEIRTEIQKRGITSDNVTDKQLGKLLKILRKELKDSKCYDGTFRVQSRLPSRYMCCKSNNFDKREMISFNRDGFIGFAGWADDRNIQPILSGVEKWLQLDKECTK